MAISSLLFQQALSEMMDRTGLKDRGAKLLTGLLGMGEAQASDDTSGAPAAGFAPVEPFVSPSMVRQGPQVELMQGLPIAQRTPADAPIVGQQDSLENLPMSETQVLNLPSRDVMEVDLTRPMYNRPAAPISKDEAESIAKKMNAAGIDSMQKAGVALALQDQAKSRMPQDGNQPPAEEPGFFGKLKNAFNNEESMLMITLALNSLRSNPDQGLATVLGGRLGKLQENRLLRGQANRSAQKLREMGREDIAGLLDEGLITAKDAISIAMKEPKTSYSLMSGAQYNEKFGGSLPENEYFNVSSQGNIQPLYDKPVMEVIGTKGAEAAVAKMPPIYDAALSAPSEINKIDETLNILKSGGANTGVFSNIAQARDSILAYFGDEEAVKSATDTQLLNAFLGSEVFKSISALGLGSRGMDTPAEREFLREVLTGKVDLTPETLIRLAERRRKEQLDAINKYQKFKDAPAMKSYTSQLIPIDYTAKDFETPSATQRPAKRIKYDAQGNRIQ